MLIPTKHLRISESIVGLGSFVLESLSKPKSIDDLWKEFQQAYIDKKYPSYHSYEELVLAIVFLYSIGVIFETDSDKLTK